MKGYAHWLADVLRAEGLAVKAHDGWETRGHGGFTDLHCVVWHHDASPPGDSPGVCTWMLKNWDKAAAQAWVGRSGEWHLLAAGVAYHAGKVRPGKPGNRHSLGVETDHTTGEDWPHAQLDSLRRGTAAILRKLNVSPHGGLEFHRTVCEPVGRKSDPHGLDLPTEQALVAELMARQGEPDMTPDEVRRIVRDEVARAVLQITGGARVRIPETGEVVDGDPERISSADVYTAVERLQGKVEELTNIVRGAR